MQICGHSHNTFCFPYLLLPSANGHQCALTSDMRATRAEFRMALEDTPRELREKSELTERLRGEVRAIEEHTIRMAAEEKIMVSQHRQVVEQAGSDARRTEEQMKMMGQEAEEMVILKERIAAQPHMVEKVRELEERIRRIDKEGRMMASQLSQERERAQLEARRMEEELGMRRWQVEEHHHRMVFLNEELAAIEAVLVVLRQMINQLENLADH